MLVLTLALVGACAGSGDDSGASPSPSTGIVGTGATTTTSEPDVCETQPLEATDVGITPDEITIFVMADVSSPRSPDLYRGAIDAVKAWADATNDEGGLACRKVVVKDWDSRMSPDDTAEGMADACKNAFAMVGTTALVVLDATVLATCPDKAGAPTGIPDIAQLAIELPHQCNATTYPINMPSADCPYSTGIRTSTQFIGAYRYYLGAVPSLHGIHLVPADLPSVFLSSIADVRASETAGIVNDGEFRVSSRDERSVYARFAQTIAEKKSIYVENGASATAMINMRKEAAAQGVTSVQVWSCQLSCYTRDFLDAGEDAEGTYVWLQFLPFEEADQNAELAAYLDAVGGLDEASPWGAGAWAGAVEFAQVVEAIVEQDGPNAVTRARVLAGLAALDEFDANGWFAPKAQRALSGCFVLVQVHAGEFVRVFPAERGTFSCDPGYLQQVQIDPRSELAG